MRSLRLGIAALVTAMIAGPATAGHIPPSLDDLDIVSPTIDVLFETALANNCGIAIAPVPLPYPLDGQGLNCGGLTRTSIRIECDGAQPESRCSITLGAAAVATRWVGAGGVTLRIGSTLCVDEEDVQWPALVGLVPTHLEVECTRVLLVPVGTCETHSFLVTLEFRGTAAPQGGTFDDGPVELCD